ncbi:MAG: CRISPR-associated protein Cas4 [Bacteroidales bacterium]|nr:CRISPR-associated protein Cas4 [Bacteroidales bacterium]
MHVYTDDEMLRLSGIQHFVFCPRQWALIHLEQAWIDNNLTMEGSLLHDRVDNPATRETNGSDIITLRGFRLVSENLGLSGIADAVEIKPFRSAPKGKAALLRSKLYSAMPVEYKRGRRKISDCDRIQTAAQAMILEEILGISIDTAAIFYWQERHREYINISTKLREDVRYISSMMHQIDSTHIIPSAEKKSACRSCSMVDLCMPDISRKSADKYLKESLTE